MRGGAPTSPEAISAAVRDICLSLPETTEQAEGWARNFEIRRRSFCLLVAAGVAADGPTGGSQPVLVIRASDDDRYAFLAMGHPFFEIPKNTWKVGLVVSEKTDWDEVRELITDSYFLVAPKKLIALLNLPADGDPR